MACADRGPSGAPSCVPRRSRSSGWVPATSNPFLRRVKVGRVAGMAWWSSGRLCVRWSRVRVMPRFVASVVLSVGTVAAGLVMLAGGANPYIGLGLLVGGLVLVATFVVAVR